MEASELTYLDIRLIEMNMGKYSVDFLAELVDKPLRMVVEKMKELGAVSEKKFYTPVPVQNKLVKEEQQREKRRLKQLEDDRKNAIRKETEKRLKLVEEQRVKREQAWGPQFKTKQIDYSQMITVRIDAKTTIYAKPGEDVTEVKRKYLARQKASSNFHKGL